MPRIHDPYLLCALYLFASPEGAERNDHLGGSGFIAGYKSQDGTMIHLYAVTNRHVIEDGFTVLRLNKLLGGYDIMETSKNSWLLHPEDDVAICPIGPDHHYHKFSVISAAEDDEKSLFVTEKKVKKYNLGVGDEVLMVGRFLSHQGSKQNLPLARFGSIAMMPIETIENSLGNKREHFLVEIRSVSGFSGSPVFVYDLPFNYAGVRPEPFGQFLLGIDCGHMPKAKSLLESGIAAIVPAWRILELLEDEQLKQMRKEEEQIRLEQRKKMGVIVPDSAKAQFTRDDFEVALKKASRKIPPKNSGD